MAELGRPPLDPSTLLRMSGPSRGWILDLVGSFLPPRNDGWRGVEDLQATLDKAESLGGKTTMPIMEIPGMVTLAQFSDPDGNVIGIVQSAG